MSPMSILQKPQKRIEGLGNELYLLAFSLQLDEMLARYASYENLGEIIWHRFASPKETLEELLKRLVFNVLSGNTDDHASNHCAFWDAKL